MQLIPLLIMSATIVGCVHSFLHHRFHHSLPFFEQQGPHVFDISLLDFTNVLPRQNTTTTQPYFNGGMSDPDSREFDIIQYERSREVKPFRHGILSWRR
ncbi:hypothetical protein AB6A40_001146 [Gnathostoma spinigerum]|uniref:Secreted protein n=1 Tax=Gnathostoma spinigerum TaxID=75299 RepID=A0ABD6ED65_9BILA